MRMERSQSCKLGVGKLYGFVRVVLKNLCDRTVVGQTSTLDVAKFCDEPDIEFKFECRCQIFQRSKRGGFSTGLVGRNGRLRCSSPFSQLLLGNFGLTPELANDIHNSTLYPIGYIGLSV